MSIDQTQFQQLAREYGPLLDQLQRELSALLPGLLWDPRTDPQMVTLRNGRKAAQAGAIYALGVPLADLNLREVTNAVNKVLMKHGFGPIAPLTGSESGYLIGDSTDVTGAQFHLLIKMELQAWIERPLRG